MQTPAVIDTLARVTGTPATGDVLVTARLLDNGKVTVVTELLGVANHWARPAATVYRSMADELAQRNGRKRVGRRQDGVGWSASFLTVIPSA